MVNFLRALADVVPFDGIGGNPGCPVWQVAYIVIARQVWKHYGESALPALNLHYEGMQELLGWFDRHADPTDGLLVTPCTKPSYPDVSYFLTTFPFIWGSIASLCFLPYKCRKIM